MAKKSYWRKSRRYGYSNRRWRNFRRYNYFDSKIEYNDICAFPSETGALSFVDAAETTKAFSSILNDSPDFTKLKAIFSFYKLKGIKIEATPAARNLNNNNINFVRQCYTCFTLQDMPTLEIAKNTDKGFVLNPLQKTSRYFPAYGYTENWVSTATGLGGRIGVFSDTNTITGTGPTWSFHVTLYLQFKYTKM